MDDFNNIIKDVFDNKEKYEKMFDGADEAEDIAIALKQIIDDDGLWKELATNRLDRIGLVALIGSFAIQFSGAIEPIVNGILGDEEINHLLVDGILGDEEEDD